MIASLHRAENTDERQRLQGILRARTGTAARDVTLHPRTRLIFERSISPYTGRRTFSNRSPILPCSGTSSGVPLLSRIRGTLKRKRSSLVRSVLQSAMRPSGRNSLRVVQTGGRDRGSRDLCRVSPGRCSRYHKCQSYTVRQCWRTHRATASPECGRRKSGGK